MPLLLAAFRASTREAWALAVIAGVIGGASMAGYYAIFIGLIGSGLVMLLRGLIAGIVVARTRAVVLGSRQWLTVLVYPALMAGFDTIVAAVSSDGTIGSLAYSQMAAVPVIQIAALVGASGIVFIVSLFGALAAIAWHRRSDIDKPWLAYGLPSALIVAGLAYGFLRIANGPAASVLPVGLIAIDRAPSTTFHRRRRSSVGSLCGSGSWSGAGGGEGRRLAGEDCPTGPRGGGSRAGVARTRCL